MILLLSFSQLIIGPRILLFESFLMIQCFWSVIFDNICVKPFGSVIFDFDNICVRCFGSVIFDNICIQCFGSLTIFSLICYKSLTIFVSDVLDLLSLTEYWKWARNWREWWFLLGDNTKRDIYLWNIILGHFIHNHTLIMHWHLWCELWYQCSSLGRHQWPQVITIN